jgi:hypothetical protein
MTTKDTYWTRIDADAIELLDDWRRTQKVIPTRRAALQTIVRQALADIRTNKTAAVTIGAVQ